MKLARQVLSALVILSTSVIIPSRADDTDLFLSPSSTDGVGVPQVLIVLDNTANWSQNASGDPKFDFEKAALKAFFDGLEEDRFKVGLELFAESGRANSNTKGGYIRSAIQLMDETNRSALSSLISNLDRNGDKADAAFFATALHEAYLYYFGKQVYVGDKAKADPDAFVTPQTQYRSPIGPSDTCAKKYVVFINNGPPDNGENNSADDLLDDLGGILDTDPIRLAPSGKQANWADEYARFLRRQGIVTYTIEIIPELTGQGPDNTALLKSMANQGGGKYFYVTDAADSAEQLKDILDFIFSEIQSVDSVYAAVTLPIDANVQGFNLNEVYMGQFRPDPNSMPRWFGNLKLYQIGYDAAANDIFLADSTGKSAENPLTGFLAANALSFWTQPSGYWAYEPRGSTASPESDSPDGDIVEKGGAAQKLRDARYDDTGDPDYDVATRTVYTLDSSGTRRPFNTDNADITAAALGANDAEERTAIIEWVLGKDNANERLLNKVRPSIHGDVVHSSPVTAPFGTDLAVFYGTNGGMLHAVWGGIGATKAGQEIWAFVPPEFYGGLKRLRDNDPKIDVPNTNGPGINPKTSFFDGSPTLVDLRDKDGAGEVFLYVPMRRGGRYIYALDVTDVSDPKFLWKRGCFQSAGSTICDPGFAELGQSWSTIRHAGVDIGGTDARVLLFGAGYDPAAEDGLPAGVAAQGRGILMLNPVTGDPIWVVGPNASCGSVSGCIALDVTEMTYPIPGKLALIDTDKSDPRILADRIYAADTGGNVWVADLRDTDPQNWTVSKLAELGGSGANARKFLYGPDVVDNSDPVCESQSAFDYAVLIGSGDREHPLDISVYRDRLGNDSLTAVSDHFYMLKDKLVETRNLPLRESDLAEIGNPNDSLAATEGWWLPLDSQEKVVGNSVTLQGSTIFATSRPPSPTIDPNTCAGNLGTARIYQVRYCDAVPLADFNKDGSADLFTTVPGGGLLPPPVPFQVTVTGQGGQAEAITGAILGTQLIEIEGAKSPISAQRTYWFKETE